MLLRWHKTTLTTEMQSEYSLSQDDARQDWQILAEETATGALMPPGDLLKSIAVAAGGLPPDTSATAAMEASAALLIESGVINE